MSNTYQYRSGISATLKALLAGLGLTFAVLLLVPLTFWLREAPERDVTLRTVDTVLPPPPPPPPPEPPREEEEKRPQHRPKLQNKPRPLTLSQLEVALNTGVGDSLAGAFATGGFEAPAIDTAAEMQTFTVAELDEEPRMIKRPRFIYPEQFKREGITGTVLLEILIEETGEVARAKVLSATRREFGEAALEMAGDMRFETPRRNGLPVRATYELPIRFELR